MFKDLQRWRSFCVCTLFFFAASMSLHGDPVSVLSFMSRSPCLVFPPSSACGSWTVLPERICFWCRPSPCQHAFCGDPSSVLSFMPRSPCLVFPPSSACGFGTVLPERICFWCRPSPCQHAFCGDPVSVLSFVPRLTLC